MSKYVKDLLTDDIKSRLEGCDGLLVVDVQGVGAVANQQLRAELRSKNIELLVIKNSLARRATKDTPLAPAFEGLDGPAAIVFGGEDLVTVAKEVVRLAKDKKFEPFQARGGVMDGAALTGDQVDAVSKWPSREEQLSILLGQILSPGATLSGQLIGPGGALASQIEEVGKRAEGGDAEQPAEAGSE